MTAVYSSQDGNANPNAIEAIQASEGRIRADLANMRSDFRRLAAFQDIVEAALAANACATPSAERAFHPFVAASSDKYEPSIYVDSTNASELQIGAGGATTLHKKGTFFSVDQGIHQRMNGDHWHDDSREALARVDFQKSGSSTKALEAHSSTNSNKSPAGTHTGNNWPASLPPRKEWQMIAHQHAPTTDLEDVFTAAADGGSLKLFVPSSILDQKKKRSWWYFFCDGRKCLAIFRPESSIRLCFELLSIAVLMFDLVYMPFSLVWGAIIHRDVAIPVAVFSSTFWTIDMCFSFATGYHTADGHAEMRLKKIAKRYLRTWFSLDFSCLVGDMVYVFPLMFFDDALDSKAGLSKLLRMAKLVRFLHLLGVVRMLRVMNIMSKFMEAQLSEGWRMMVRISEMTACLVWLGHICACGWYGVGQGSAGFGESEIEQMTWLESGVGLHKELLVQDLSWWHQYVTSYHWALAQITLGAHDINPINTLERVFTIICNLFGILLGGTLIAILSNTLIYLKELNQERAAKMRVLKEFLLQHEVDIGVRMRVLEQVQDRVIQREHVLVEDDVPALQVLSRGLLRDLRCNLFQPPVLSHMVFRAWTCFSETCLETLCETGIEFLVQLRDDELFKTGMPSVAGYHVLKGMMKYNIGNSGGPTMVKTPKHKEKHHGLPGLPGKPFSSSGRSATTTLDTELMPGVDVEAGSWLCEATWWCHWHHVGTATCITEPCTLLSVAPETVLAAARQDLAVTAITAEYAKLFHQRVADAGRGNLPNDLRVHYAAFSDLIFAMPQDVRIVLGLASLKQVLSGYVPTKLEASLMELEEEIRQGRSVVLLDEKGSLQRQVALALLRIEHNTKVLVLVGQYDTAKEEWNATCKLPGIKQKLGETPKATMQRFVEERVAVFRGESEWDHFHTRQELSESSQYGIGTTYTKNTFMLDCSSELFLKLQSHSRAIQHGGEATQELRHNVTSQSEILRSARVHTMSARNPSTLSENEEDLKQVLHSINEVYILYGTESIGLYVWMEEESIEPLSHDQYLLNRWVSGLGGLLTEFEEVGELLASDADGSAPAEEPVHSYSKLIAGTKHYYHTV